MIDTCDENIIAMYHFTDDDRVMGSIDGAKKLTQTVKNSKYTTKDNEEIGRIHVSLLTSSDKAIDENSYAYELAEISGGFVYSGASQVKAEPMVMRLALTEDTAKTEQTKETNGNLIEILGEGGLASYRIITSTGSTKGIQLDAVLKKGSKTDSDDDGLYDWDEVNVGIVEKYLGKNFGEIDMIKNSVLPTIKDLTDHSFKWESWKSYIGGIEGYVNRQNQGILDTVAILPILSDPRDKDSDGDGFYDGITGKYSPIGYYNVKDKWPLTNKPRQEFYQKDGNYYFSPLQFPETNVGGRKNEKGTPKSYTKSILKLTYSEQKYIYDLCAVANTNKEAPKIDPLIVMSICAHESSCRTITHKGGATGYMQLMPKYITSYFDEKVYYNNNQRRIKDIINRSVEDKKLTKDNFNLLKDGNVSKEKIQEIIVDPYVNITLGIAMLNEWLTFENDLWEGLYKYCGDKYSPKEDYFYRNNLAVLIEEECKYEDKYDCKEPYSITLISSYNN